MVLAYHVIFCAYGFWLPNDPRGSWSEFVRCWELARFGPSTKTGTRRSVAHVEHDHARRMAAKAALKRPAVQFSGIQARAIGRGFGDFVEKSGLIVWACSILPEHVHMVICRHRYKIEQVANLLKGAATRQLVDEALHPFLNEIDEDGKRPSPWAQKEWKVYLNSATEIERAIRYVEENPLKEGKPRQTWPFVSPSGEIF